MAVVHYGDGTLYGAVDAYYGRVSGELAAAQSTHSRETGLIVKVIDERTNRWSSLVENADQNPTEYSRVTAFTNFAARTGQLYWSYRGQSDACVLDNGTIVRVRVHIDTLDIEYQEITDPTNVAQWTAWSTLYAGPYYSVAIAPNGNSYIVYGSKTNGVYRNNSLVWTKTNIMGIICHKDSSGRQVKDRLWIKEALPGAYSEAAAQLRKFDQYYTPDITATTPVEVPWNYQWFRSDVVSIARTDGKVLRITSYPMYAPHAINAGETIAVELIDSVTNLGTELKGPRIIRGMPSDYGHNHVSGLNVTRAQDGYYYLFYKEIHVGNEWEFTSSPAIATVWQRSKDGLTWSEPVHTGHDEWALSGIVEADDYMYLMGNASVYRRPTTSVEYEYTNYVPRVEWDSPRDNQAGNGMMTVANPDDVNAGLLDLADRRVVIQPGIKTSDGYEFASLDDFWLKRVTREIDGEINRLQVDFGNIWARLENPLRDVYNFVGKTVYEDFKSGAPNEAFSYYFDDSTEPTVTDAFALEATGKVLWTAWKGLNPYFHVSFAGSEITLYLRYEDEDNYLKLVYSGSAVTLSEVSNKSGAVTTTQIGTSSTSGVSRLGIRARWKYFDIYKNDALLTTFTHDSPILNKSGYVGWEGSTSYSNFIFEDLEFDYTTADIIQQALALGGYHDTKIGGATTRQYALIWGPQTDVPDAASGLKLALETEKFELIWRDGFIEVGKFTDTGAYKTIEDRIIRTEQIQEGNRRINLANIDGNEHTWMQVDIADALARDRMINAYFDLPELETEDEVKARALEEIRRSKMSDTPGGTVPLFFDLWRMDPVMWVDNAGNSKLVRIEGMRVIINQSKQPSQRQELDTSLIEDA